MKFKIGDKVRIVDNSIFDSSYRVGSICIIDDIYNDGALRLVMSDCRFQGVTRNHYSYIEKVEDKYMNITDAVNYCLNHKAVIHTPSNDIFDSLMSYLDESILRWSNGYKASGFDCYSTHKEDTCIRVTRQGYKIGYSDISYYIDNGYEIIDITSVSIDGISYSNKDKAISKIESIFSSFPSVGGYILLYQ